MSWLNFAAGFAGAVARDIEDRSEQIRKDTEATIARRAKEKAEAEEKAEQKRDQLKAEFRALRTVIPNLTEEQAVGIISNGLGEYVLKQAAQKKLTADETQRLFKMTPGQKGMRFDEYLTATTTLKRGAPVASELPGDTGPFGLKLTAGEQARKSAIARSGYSEEQLGATKMGAEPEVTGAMDVSVFAEPQKIISKEMRVADFAQKIYDAKLAGDTNLAKSLTKQRDAYLESFPADKDKDKALTFANRQTIFNTAIRTAVQRNTLKLGNAEFNIVNGEPQFKGNAEQTKVFNSITVDAVRNAGLSMADQNGRVDKDTAQQLKAFGVEVDNTNRIVIPEVAAPAPAAAPAAPKAPAVAGLPQTVTIKEKVYPRPAGMSDADWKQYITEEKEKEEKEKLKKQQGAK